MENSNEILDIIRKGPEPPPEDEIDLIDSIGRCLMVMTFLLPIIFIIMNILGFKI